MLQYFYLKKECCIYFNSNGQNRADKNNMNFTSINFLNNEAIINDNYNLKQNGKYINSNITPENGGINLNNKDNNMSKSQLKEFNNNINGGYYSVSPLDFIKLKNNDNIKENNDNFQLLSNNYRNLKEIQKMNFNDDLNFDISPQKKNLSRKKNESFKESLNNLDSLDEIDNVNNKNMDSLKYEKMAERQEDKKRGKVMDRIVKGRARLNDSNKNKNDLKNSNIMEKSKLYEKVLGNNSKSEELEYIEIMSDKKENSEN